MHIVKIHNLETGEIIERERNANELAQYELDEAKRLADLAEAVSKATAKAAAEAKLAALGLTADDLKALGL